MCLIILYTSPGCASCRKAKQWLKDNDLKFVEKNIFTTLLKEDEIKYLLSRTENGTEDIISTRSKVFQEMDVNLDDMGLNELVQFIRENPSIMKRPIILNETNLVVGYDDDEITSFIPSEVRKAARKACSPNCANYDVCGYVRKEDEN